MRHVCLHTDPFDDPGSGDVGGMNVVVRQCAEAMAAAGHTVEVVTRRSLDTAPELETRTDGLVVRRLEAGPVTRLPKGAHEDVIAEFARVLSTLPDPDLVHSHHWFSGLAALPLARRRGVPHVQSFHSIAAAPGTTLAHGERPESPGRLDGELRLARSSDLLIAVSAAEAETIADRLGADPQRIVISRPGVDSDVFAPAPQGLPAGPGRAVVAARLEPLKGLDLAIDALAEIPGPHRPDLVIAGGPSADEEYPGTLARRAAEHGVTDRVTFLGPVSRSALADLLRGARMLLVPSHSETYGLVALEAAAAGVPVIAASTGGLREAVIDGTTGLLLDSRDPSTWGCAIERLATDDVMASRLGRAGRAHAEDRSWEASAARMIAAYRDVIAER